MVESHLLRVVSFQELPRYHVMATLDIMKIMINSKGAKGEMRMKKVEQKKRRHEKEKKEIE